MRKLIFLDKVVVYLKENLDKTREEVEENLEIIIKRSIVDYLVNKRKLNIEEMSDATVTLVIDFEKDENKLKLIIEEYMFEMNYKNEVLFRMFRLGLDNEHFIHQDLKELENEINVFENGIGIPLN
ncbi:MULTISPECIES: hypothetical protein [unclassified Leptotrichia]|jgi:hypothetical protein|uniref:hypothetical protein n=1 Tax=unclassified Leptotrichia TaxID=2633022 RepID=UPI0020130CE4|nr:MULTISPECIES: hypothetical protein [unclassified Leptotrichia]